MMMSLDYQYCCVVVSLRVGAIALNLPISCLQSLEFSLADVLTPQETLFWPRAFCSHRPRRSVATIHFDAPP